MITHGDLVNLLLLDLSPHGLAWSNATGAMKNGDRFIRYGLVGSSDILMAVRHMGGRLACIECKVNRDRWRPDQQAFAKAAQDANAIYILAWSKDGTGNDARAYVNKELNL